MTKRLFLKYTDLRVLLPEIVTELCTFLVGIVVLSVYLLVILLALPMYLFRFVLSKVTKLGYHPNLGNMVTARGQFLAIEQFTSPEKSPRSNIVASVVLDGCISIDQLRETIQKNLLDAKDPNSNELRYPEAQQFITSYIGYKYWAQDEHFQIENHVKTVNPREGQDISPVSWCQLEAFIEDLVNQSFHLQRSPWEILLVENYTNPELKPTGEKMSVIIFRFHHCLADGYGAVFTLISALGSQPASMPVPKYADRDKLRFLLFKLTYPLRMIREISHLIVISLKDSPWKIPDQRKKWKQILQVSSIVPTSRIKDIKNRFGVSFSGVLHSCLAAAMEKCLLSKYGLPKSHGQQTTPCVMMLPLRDHPRKLRNHCTGAFVRLPTCNMEPITRLHKCESDINLVKRSTMPFLGQYIPIIGGSMVSRLARLIGKNRSFPVSISNFPFGDTHYYALEHKVLHVYATAGAGAGVAGLGFLIYSYTDRVQVSVVGEQAVFSREDLKLLIDSFQDEIEQLYNLSVV